MLRIASADIRVHTRKPHLLDCLRDARVRVRFPYRWPEGSALFIDSKCLEGILYARRESRVMELILALAEMAARYAKRPDCIPDSDALDINLISRHSVGEICQ